MHQQCRGTVQIALLCQPGQHVGAVIVVAPCNVDVALLGRSGVQVVLQQAAAGRVVSSGVTWGVRCSVPVQSSGLAPGSDPFRRRRDPTNHANRAQIPFARKGSDHRIRTRRRRSRTPGAVRWRGSRSACRSGPWVRTNSAGRHSACWSGWSRSTTPARCAGPARAEVVACTSVEGGHARHRLVVGVGVVALAGVLGTQAGEAVAVPADLAGGHALRRIHRDLVGHRYDRTARV